MSDGIVPLNNVRTKSYVMTWAALMALTAVTVAVSRLNLLSFAAVVSIGIASLKSFLVLMFFMHLKEEPLILKVMLVVAVSALALIILLTFTDVWFRWGSHAHP